MTSLGEEVKFGRNLCVFESLKVDERAFDVGRVVVLGLEEKRRRNLRRGLE